MLDHQRVPLSEDRLGSQQAGLAYLILLCDFKKLAVILFQDLVVLLLKLLDRSGAHRAVAQQDTLRAGELMTVGSNLS